MNHSINFVLLSQFVKNVIALSGFGLRGSFLLQQLMGVSKTNDKSLLKFVFVILQLPLMNFLEEQEQFIQVRWPQGSFKTNSVPTYATQTLSPVKLTVENFPSSLKPLKTPKTSEDISFEEEIFKGNAQLMQAAVFQYYRQSLGERFDEFQGRFLKNSFGLKPNTEYDEQQSMIQLIITKNRLLSPENQKKLYNYFVQFQQLGSFFKQLQALLGITLTQELSFIMFEILTLKAQGFRKLEQSQVLELIPHIERFWGDQDKMGLAQNGWEVYQDIDDAKIKKFALENMEELASKLYFAPELRFLNLSHNEVTSSDGSSKFEGLVCLFAQSLFLTMSDMRQQRSDLQEFLQELRLESTFGEVQFKNPTKLVKLQ